MGCGGSAPASAPQRRSNDGGGGGGGELELTEDLAGAWVPTRQDLWSLSVETWGELLPNVVEIFEGDGGGGGVNKTIHEVQRDGSCRCTFGEYCSTSGQWYKDGSRYVCFSQVTDSRYKNFIGREAKAEAVIIPSSSLTVKIDVTLTDGPSAGKKHFPMCYKRVPQMQAPAFGQPVVKSL